MTCSVAKSAHETGCHVLYKLQQAVLTIFYNVLPARKAMSRSCPAADSLKLSGVHLQLCA